MSLAVVTFYAFATVIIASSILVVTRRNAITSALFLAVSLVSIAGLFVSLRAEFLFAVQILVYTGGVMVLFLFVIMLVNVDDLQHLRPTIRKWWLPVGFVGFSFAILAAHAARVDRGPVGEWVVGSNTKELALALLTDYLLPFEVVSILLLVAMVGAIVLSKKEA